VGIFSNETLALVYLETVNEALVSDRYPVNEVYQFKIREQTFPPVLVVDDFSFNRLVIVEMLKSVSIECAEAESGPEAIALVIKRATELKPIEVVLMDFEMPGMNGPTASRTLLAMMQERGLQAPKIIAHTAYTSDEDILVCRGAGMVDFIPKPSSRALILSKIRQFL
jgi:CheY-like chemotaxis protein